VFEIERKMNKWWENFDWLSWTCLLLDLHYNIIWCNVVVIRSVCCWIMISL